jgi:nucleoside-diphosphate-sugar epimerase
MTTALVLGGSGFLGRHVVAALAADPRITRVLSPPRNSCDVMTAAPGKLQEVLAGFDPDVVVNCTGRLDGSAEHLAEANTAVTAKLLAVMEGSRARLVRIGSAGEYGVVPVGVPVAEDAPAAPVGPYGASHLEATRLVEQAHRTGRVDALTLRVFNPIGTGLNGSTVLGSAATQMREVLRGARHHVRLGPLGAFRDFVDARDVASAVVAATFAPSTRPTYNVAGGRATSVRDAVSLLAQVAGYTGEVREAPSLPGRSAGVDWIQADIGRAREDLGWQPQHALRDSLTCIWRDVAPVDRRPGMDAPTVPRRPAAATSIPLGGRS